MNTNENYPNLGAAIVLQATKDYFKSTKEMKQVILKDLRSDYLYQLSGGASVVVAEQLERHPKEIAKRLKMYREELM